MKKIELAQQKFSTLLSPIIGEVKVKTYFSYYGLFNYQDYLFALYKEGDFYLKVAKKHLPQIQHIEKVFQLEAADIGIHSKDFYFIPTQIVGELQTHPEWFMDLFTEIEEKQKKIVKSKTSLIRHLPNMNINLERLIKKCGVNTVEELTQRGEISIYIDLVKQGIDVNEVFIFKVYGAIKRQFIYHLTPEVKRKILIDANQALYNAGFRRRFKVD